MIRLLRVGVAATLLSVVMLASHVGGGSTGTARAWWGSTETVAGRMSCFSYSLPCSTVTLSGPGYYQTVGVSWASTFSFSNVPKNQTYTLSTSRGWDHCSWPVWIGDAWNNYWYLGWWNCG